MSNEVNVTQMNNDLDVIEENHKNQILSIHENMAELIERCNSIQVFEDDKESYDDAVELKRYVKSVHVSIDKKRKELKQPIIDWLTAAKAQRYTQTRRQLPPTDNPNN